MPNIQKILVPVDLSPLTDKTISYACDLAKKYDAKPTLFFVNRPPAAYFPEEFVELPSQLFQDLFEHYEKSLTLAKEEAERQSMIPIDMKISTGIPATEILREAKEGGYDLIVIGSHGRTGLAHTFLGSVAEKVLRHAPCPVLVVRAESRT